MFISAFCSNQGSELENMTSQTTEYDETSVINSIRVNRGQRTQIWSLLLMMAQRLNV